MKHLLNIWSALLGLLLVLPAIGQEITLVNLTPQSKRAAFGTEQLETELARLGYTVRKAARVPAKRQTIVIAEQGDAAGRFMQSHAITMPEGIGKEGFYIRTKGPVTLVCGVDGTGALYGCRELIDRAKAAGELSLPEELADAPEMVLRGTCIGVQKPYYLPGRTVYEYPYTESVFPWLYDKAMWIEYLDMLVENRMNSVYLWNGHPFASLVRVPEYDFAVEVTDEEFRQNEELFSFLTQEADRRGIFVIQMFYNIIVSKPFAEHYGIKTQERNRPIIPYIADYTRKSIAAFIEKYPNVGLLACLGEAMATVEDDVTWFTEVVIPGVKDGLKALGRTDEPPLLLRAHDTDCKRVMDAALPLYKNLYTMHKYTGESLTTYQPRGPWGKIHKDLSSLGSVHISNVHILANLEPFRWGSPKFVQKTVQAMHNVHGANALHLYPQASYWDYPYTADKLAGGARLKQIDRDWIWFKEWGRYAWKADRDASEEAAYWADAVARRYGCSAAAARRIVSAYDESGEIAPKLLRRFGITEGNRQTLLLGMTMSQLVNPYRYTIYPGFYESCGPEGEKLIEFVEKEWKNRPHEGELPLDIVGQTIEHGDRAVREIERAAAEVKGNAEFERLRNDMHCYREFAYAFYYKVHAARAVLDYGWGGDLAALEDALPLLEKSLAHYRRLVELTDRSYYYANSMQTKQRRIPVSGADGKNKTWAELLPLYQAEYDNLKRNIERLKNPNEAEQTKRHPQLHPVAVAATVNGRPVTTAAIAEGASLYTTGDGRIEQYAPELEGLQAIVADQEQMKAEGTTLRFRCEAPVNLLVGYYVSDKKGLAQAPKLETDASANDYGQADAVISHALTVNGMPALHVHVYSFGAGEHELLLTRGVLALLGFTDSTPVKHDAGLSASFAGNNLDDLFN